MKYAKFYQASAVDPSKLVEAVGDRSVIIFDGRLGVATRKAIASNVAKVRGYLAYQLCEGESFTRTTKRSEIYRVEP